MFTLQSTRIANKHVMRCALCTALCAMLCCCACAHYNS
nr:MAG TPA: hypothetical protein [Caudoviricetes sp.]